MYNFPVDDGTINISDIKDTHRYLMKNHNIVYMLGFFKQAFIVLAFWLGGSLATKCVSLNNQPCTSRPTFIDLNLNYYLLTTIYYHV